MKFLLISLLVFLMTLILQTEAERSGPARDLEDLLRTEEAIIKSLRSYVRAEKKRVDFLEKYLERAKIEYEIAIKDVPYYLGNPINAYTIIKRLGPDLSYAEEILRNKTVLVIPAAAFPTEEDLMHSALSLATMLNLYNLNVSQVANGIINITTGPNGEVFTETTTPMTASDCYSIGEFLVVKKRYQDAIPWLEEAYRKVEGVKCVICPVRATEVIDHLCMAYHELGHLKKYIEWAKKRIALSPSESESIEYEKHIRMHSRDVDKKSEVRPLPLGYCIAGGPSSSKNLCYYAHGPHPIFTLGPLKTEQLHTDPDLYLYYDALSDREVEAIKAFTNSQLRNSTRRDLNIYQNSEFIPVDGEASEAVARASRRVAQLTGIGQNQWRNQVINIGVGRFRRERLDSKYTKRLNAAKESISATVLFYLSEVELGGGTTFPLLNLTVIPKKGAALFYSNRLPSGEWDLLLEESSCPILRGTKWVAVNHLKNTSECRVWKTEKGIVTHKMYKEILKQRQTRINRI